MYGLALFARKHTKKKRFAEYWLFSNAIMAVISSLYSFFIIPYYREAPTSDRYIIRLLFHPLLFSFSEMMWRFCLIHFGTEDHQTAHYASFIIKISNAVYGRMFIVALSSLSTATEFLILSAVAELIVKITYRLRERSANWVVNKVTKGKMTINKDLYHRNMTILANMYLMETYCEVVIIAISPFLFWSYNRNRLQFDFIYSSNNSDLGPPLANAAINLAFELTVQFIGLNLLILQGIPILSSIHWRQWLCKDSYTRVIMLIQCFSIFIYLYRTWPIFVFCKADNGCECNFPQHVPICNGTNVIT